LAIIADSEIERLRRERIEELKRIRSEGQKVVGYICQYVPVEIIQAAGAIGVRLARADYLSSLLGEQFLRADACPFCKSCLGKFETDPLYQLTDALVFVNTCDMMRRLPEAVGAQKNLPVFQVYLPRNSEPCLNRIEEFERQLALLRDGLTNLTGRNWDDHRLLTAIKDYNLIRALLTRIDSARQTLPPLVKGSEILDIVALSWLLSPKQAIDLLTEVSQRLNALNLRRKTEDINPELGPPSFRPRVMIAGSILTEDDREVIQMLEAQADIVADELCTGVRFFAGQIELDKGPLRAIARFYFNRIPCAYRRPNDLLYEHLQQLIQERRVQGVIYKTLLYCDPWRFEAKHLRQMLKIPVLEIDGDYSGANIEQLRTRIEAFIETLGQHQEADGEF